MTRIDRAHGEGLERIAELNGVTRVSVWEPDRSLNARAVQAWIHFASRGTQLRAGGPERAWWAPLEWAWWRAVSLVRRVLG